MSVQSASPAQRRVLEAMAARRFFKLICGGSFTDADRAGGLAAIYARAGADCIDIAPDPPVLSAVRHAFATLPEEIPRPLVMVSLPLDPDPHFRKIELIEPACVACMACVPVCPTEAISPVDDPGIAIAQALCYGCGRCPAVCPTEALVLHPFRVDDEVQAVLADPLVEAVELHTAYADPYMLPDFLEKYRTLLRDKLISVCFRPESVPQSQWRQFLDELNGISQLPLILQIDGKPMSGSDDPTASLPSLQSARIVAEVAGEKYPYITISGGINAATAECLRQPDYAFICGAGMGTVARRHVWNVLDRPGEALLLARELVNGFKRPQS